ncbi:MAG: hypothetical protein R3265_09910 [Hyphomonas sp.]|nr:hypothetical protein [Hyphomonas sp.]
MGTGNKVEMLIAICAVLTSAIAVFIAWDQGRVMRAQQHGAVYPVMQIDGFVSKSADTASMGIHVSNSGVGPALIEQVRMLRNDEPIASLTPYVDRMPSGYDLSWTSLVGRAVAPGSKVAPLRVDWLRDEISDEQLDAVAKEWSQLDAEICYCSVFERCWVTRGLGMGRTMGRAERVKSCERSEVDLFEAVANAPRASDTETISEVE